MLAKLITAGLAKPFSPVEWPLASTISEKATVSAPEPEPLPRDVTELRTEIALLKAELARAREEAQRRVEEAHDAGRRDADQAARQLFQQQLEAELSKLRQMIRDLALSGGKLRRQAEEDLVRLSVAIARRILHRELTIDPDALGGLVKTAFERLDQREIHQLRTDPDSAATVRKVVESLGLPRTATVVSDTSLRPGSLLIETVRGELDASIETQLNEIQRGFIDIVHHS
jgi:flagellar assembly protein FliH